MLLETLQKLNHFLALQGSTNPPPPSKMGPAPPVGDVVPIDDNLWVLVAVAVIVGVIYINKRRKQLATQVQ
jgi:hypothetical protein